jgi:hypothetical protein
LIMPLNVRQLVLKKTGSSALSAVASVPIDISQRVLKMAGGRANSGSYDIHAVEFFDSGFDGLWQKVKDGLGISIWKDSEYLNWRYIRRPNVQYNVFSAGKGQIPEGFIVTRIVESKYRIGHIVDLMASPDNLSCLPVLIQTAISQLRESGAEVIVCDMFQHHPGYRFIAKAGFMQWKQGGFWMIDKLVESIFPDVEIAGNWNLNRGDSDGI